MIVNCDFYKKTGKFYANGIAEIPDNSSINDQNISQLILKKQDVIRDDAVNDFICVVYLPEEEQLRLPEKFFKKIINI